MRKKTSNTQSRAMIVDAVWYDEIAGQCFELITKRKDDARLTPSLHLLGRWLAEAGFTAGRHVQVHVSPAMITLKLRRKSNSKPV